MTKSIIQDPRLRERNYGKDEGVHYDSLKKEEKQKFEDFNYKPEGGESWVDVQKRTHLFFQSLKTPGNYLAFTCGGLICANTFDLGLVDVIPNCSCVALELDANSKPSKILFEWELPEIQEQK
jgi:Fructose-2,6-bisphosphatase